ncbi:MAG: endonuclease/exonuclease/phosphatase family protein [Anaerolineae bacterium]|nr:endonuclease/exonuclease/phosphatase family protein [Anaerolineae bacterium]
MGQNRIDHSDYPRLVVEDIVRLRRRIEHSRLPAKLVDRNLLIGTWNIRSLSQVYKEWDENPGSPKRNLRAMAYIAEIVRRYDVIAIQEVKRDTSGLRILLEQFLGPNWGLIVSDVSAGARGNAERLAFIYDKRRVEPSGLAGEIVLPPTTEGDPVQQFDRTPYIVGFKSAGEDFTLLTAHIKYGDVPEDRLEELKALADYIAAEIRDRAKAGAEENNLIVLGDFNIDDRGDTPLFEAFVSSGLVVPSQLLNLKTTYATKPKYYDQIAWFMGDLDLLAGDQAGVIDFAGAVYQDLPPVQMSYRVSDHLPLWVEFLVDRSEEHMAQTLGVDVAMPDPFGCVPE